MSNSFFNVPTINRLSYDIFSRIIRAVEPLEPIPDVELMLNLPWQYPHSPLTASHVCHSWRKSLLSDPTMWAYIMTDEFKPRAIKEFIRRSRSTPLKVLIGVKNHSKSITPASISVIFWEIHRFQFLQVSIKLDDESNFCLNNLQFSAQKVLTCLVEQPAPELQSFLFSYENNGISPSPAFFENIFSGNAPKLKYISHHLSGDLRELNCPLFCNLSTLSLRLPYPAIYFSHFLDILQLSPGLTVLQLFDAVPDRTPIVPTRNRACYERTVYLPHLKWLSLKLYRSVDLRNCILEHVIFSPDAKWQITSEEPQPEPDEPETGFGDEAVDSIDGNIYNLKEDKNKKLFQFLQSHNSRFTFLLIFITGEGSVDLIFAEENNFSHLQDPNNNKFLQTYDDVSQFTKNWPVLRKSIDFSGIIHLEFIFACDNWPMIDMENIILGTRRLETLKVRFYADTCPSDIQLWAFLSPMTSPPPLMRHPDACLFITPSNIEIQHRPDSDNADSNPDDGSEARTVPNSPILTIIDIYTDGMTAIPPLIHLPSLRTLTITTRFLTRLHLSSLRDLHEKRRKQNRPIKIKVRSHTVEEEVEAEFLGPIKCDEEGDYFEVFPDE